MLTVTFHHRTIDGSDIVWEELATIRKWCALPYPSHSGGCPNSEDCYLFRDDLRELVSRSRKVHLAWLEFDLDVHAANMKRKHPEWSDRQCRNLLYWQKSLKRELKRYTLENVRGLPILGAEGGGVNFYKTMRGLGVRLEIPRKLRTVRMIALVLEGIN